MYLNTKSLLAVLLFSTAQAHSGLNNDETLNNLVSSAPPAMASKIRKFRRAFMEWKDDHDKVYSLIEEEVERMLVWIGNHEYIENHNSQNTESSYTVAHNAFSDMTNDEFQQYHRLGKYSPGKEVLELKFKERQAMKKLHANDPAQQEIRYLLAKARQMESGSEDGKDENKVGLFDDLFDDDATGTDDDGAEALDDDAAGTDDDGKTEDDDNTPDTDDDTDGLPDKIDWVAAGAVTPIKNQGNCGSCWAFSSTGAIEGAHFVETGELVSLSEQNIMDCDTADSACEGGLMENAFEFEESQNGLCSEDEYPYLATDDSVCSTNCTKVPHTQVKSYTDLPAGDKHALIASIVVQPTSIAMDAGALAFQFYSSGVFSDDSCGADGSIDHGVLAVGYGTDEDSGMTYFRVKNSWGESWGEDGYFRLKRHSPNQYGTCAILAYMTAPTLV
mmetsp:Transcript_6657/g.9755  ORF Transcript_6657/g.9755 Transcript_6657/m.9755 type:complete len:445 (-) Transcript_6657:191-1525(-)|eukprot:CAMPEP_0197233378 /NCGR_PEP_ID=MMETSP1429-20130617/1437_1 /TAXON_ID=49237 /ORGANISM="Chaetoceros  sp., Strain UNC1202" /LENGTH=444 /DNA_ID=CAMNT_0042691605 /DNA_START=119 /DNA_END=1453 /DNA_ORIENTATION=-